MEGATRGPRGRGRAQGVGHALDPRGQVLAPLLCSQCQIFSDILEKIIFNFQGIWRTFIFVVFLYCTDNQITDRKSKNGVQKVVASSYIHLMIIKRNPLTRLIKSC